VLSYTENEFISLLQDNFCDEIQQYKLKFKILKLNDLDVLLLIISENNSRHTNSTVMNTDIKFEQVLTSTPNEIDYIINVYENSIEDLYKKIKKTIFDICLVK